MSAASRSVVDSEMLKNVPSCASVDVAAVADAVGPRERIVPEVPSSFKSAFSTVHLPLFELTGIGAYGSKRGRVP